MSPFHVLFSFVNQKNKKKMSINNVFNVCIPLRRTLSSNGQFQIWSPAKPLAFPRNTILKQLVHALACVYRVIRCTREVWRAREKRRVLTFWCRKPSV